MTTLDSSPISQMSIREHFSEALESATRNQDVVLGEMAFVYLINLLTEYCHSAALAPVSDDGRHLRPLALLYAEAVETDSSEHRHRALQRLGDVALFIAGIFTDSLSRRVVDVDYYISMGEAAYGHLHQSLSQRAHPFRASDLFDELGRKFAPLVDVLGEISETSGLKSNSDLLRTYDIWLRTGSERARKQLARSGIHPLAGAGARNTH